MAHLKTTPPSGARREERGFVPESQARSAKAERLKTSRIAKTERSEGLAERVGFEPGKTL
jgi:hypothetical protein